MTPVSMLQYQIVVFILNRKEQKHGSTVKFEYAGAS